MREQIAEYLAKGYKAAQIAELCGCSQAYISELVKTDESFRELLKQKMATYVQERISTRYDRLEESTLKQLEGVIEGCDVAELTRVLESIAKIKNANKAVIMPAHYTNPTVGLVLQLSINAHPKVITDDSNRVTAIGDRTMVPMPARAVKNMFEARILEEKKDVKEPEEHAAPGPVAIRSA